MDELEEIAAGTVLECKDDGWEEGVVGALFSMFGILARASDPFALFVVLQPEPAQDEPGAVGLTVREG